MHRRSEITPSDSSGPPRPRAAAASRSLLAIGAAAAARDCGRAQRRSRPHAAASLPTRCRHTGRTMATGSSTRATTRTSLPSARGCPRGTRAPSWWRPSTSCVAAGYLEERRTAPSPSARYRSRFRATPKLIEAIGPVDLSYLHCSETPPVILRCRRDRRPLNPAEVLDAAGMAELGQIALDVEEHNTFLASFEVTFDKNVAQVLPSGLVKVGDLHLNPTVAHLLSRVQRGSTARRSVVRAVLAERARSPSPEAAH